VKSRARAPSATDVLPGARRATDAGGGRARLPAGPTSSIVFTRIWIAMRRVAPKCSLALVLLAIFAAGLPAQTRRSVAITIDDLPWARDAAFNDEQLGALTTRLVAQIRAARMPAVGFVNEGKLERGTGRAALLGQWVDAGLELGNHTYSHRSFFTTPLDTFQADVLRGERVTRRLMAERRTKPRFFRHPFLNTGPDLTTKAEFERFLGRHGYRVAPVTVDTEDYIFALAYDRAAARGDSAGMRRIGGEYLRHTDTTFAYYEGLSRRLLGREPAQILLLHANQLNTDYLDELATLLRARGYTFATLDRAMRDPAYREPDRYAGRAGMSWLQRWAITRGTRPDPEPVVATWITEATR
jgi:peptidoglycan/xylan/chitin deacetylase (PgdA/CDA1 family)